MTGYHTKGTRHKCRGLCSVWKGSIRFIYHLSRYAVADKCRTCVCWYPKYALKKCPCCKSSLGRRRQKLNNQRYSFPLKSNEEVISVIERSVKEGWSLIKTDSLQKAICDYEILCEFDRLRLSKLQGFRKPLFLWKERTDYGEINQST